MQLIWCKTPEASRSWIDFYLHSRCFVHLLHPFLKQGNNFSFSSTGKILAFKGVQIKTSFRINVGSRASRDLKNINMEPFMIPIYFCCSREGCEAFLDFPSAWRWVNNEWILIFGWIYPLKSEVSHPHFEENHPHLLWKTRNTKKNAKNHLARWLNSPVNQTRHRRNLLLRAEYFPTGIFKWYIEIQDNAQKQTGCVNREKAWDVNSVAFLKTLLTCIQPNHYPGVILVVL